MEVVAIVRLNGGRAHDYRDVVLAPEPVRFVDKSPTGTLR